MVQMNEDPVIPRTYNSLQAVELEENRSILANCPPNPRPASKSLSSTLLEILSPFGSHGSWIGGEPLQIETNRQPNWINKRNLLYQ